jgi:hypothetical protein
MFARGLRGVELVVAKLVLVALVAVVSLARPAAVLDPTGMGGLLPQWAAMVWAALVLVLCVVGTGALLRHLIELASWALLGLCFLIGLNSAVTISVNGVGATWAATGYAVVAFAFYDRATALHAGRLLLGPPPDDLPGSR